jgi:putative copper export protein
MSDESLAEVLLVVSRLIWYAGCLGVVGASAFRLLVAPVGDTLLVDLGRSAAVTGLVAGLVLLAGTFCRLYAQTYAWFGLDEPVTWRLLVEVATDIPPWSTGWMAQAGAGAACVLALAAVRRGHRAAWTPAYLSSAAVVLTAPLTGHAVAQPGGYVLPVVLQALHVLGAGVWIGGLVVMLVVIGRAAASSSGIAGPMVRRFSPVALAGAGLLASTGIATAFLYLGEPRDLWSTEYGRTLLVKIAGFAGVAAMGFVNWQHVRPQLTLGGGTALLRRTATIELTLAVLVLALTARLTGLPQP